MERRTTRPDRKSNRGATDVRRITQQIAHDRAMIAEARAMTAEAMKTARHFRAIAREKWRIENERRESLGIPPLPWTHGDDP